MRWFNQLKIGLQFTIISSLVLSFVMALSGVAIWGVIQFQDFLNEVQGDQIPEILNNSEALGSVRASQVQVHQLLHGEDTVLDIPKALSEIKSEGGGTTYTVALVAAVHEFNDPTTV